MQAYNFGSVIKAEVFVDVLLTHPKADTTVVFKPMLFQHQPDRFSDDLSDNPLATFVVVGFLPAVRGPSIGKPGISVAPYIINGYSQFTPNDATISASEVTQVPLADGTVNTVMTFTIEKMSAITPGYKINSKGSNMVKFAHGIGNVFDGVTPHLTKGGGAITIAVRLKVLGSTSRWYV